MAALSISKAWDDTKARVAADGRLFAIVAAALIALPALVVGVVAPKGVASGGIGPQLLTLVGSLIALVGQLAIIHLAIAASVSVGDAIVHGARRMPIYVVAGLIVVAAFFLLAIPFVAVLVATGVPMQEGAIAKSPTAMLLALIYCIVIIFVSVRLLLTSPVASEEAVGPIAIIRRSWELTGGHWWRLFAFIVLFFIGAALAMAAVRAAFGSVAVVLFGPVAPLSASALIVAVVDAVMNAIITILLAVMLARIYVQLAGRHVSVPRSGI